MGDKGVDPRSKRTLFAQCRSFYVAALGDGRVQDSQRQRLPATVVTGLAGVTFMYIPPRRDSPQGFFAITVGDHPEVLIWPDTSMTSLRADQRNTVLGFLTRHDF